MSPRFNASSPFQPSVPGTLALDQNRDPNRYPRVAQRTPRFPGDEPASAVHQATIRWPDEPGRWRDAGLVSTRLGDPGGVLRGAVRGGSSCVSYYCDRNYGGILVVIRGLQGGPPFLSACHGSLSRPAKGRDEREAAEAQTRKRRPGGRRGQPGGARHLRRRALSACRAKRRQPISFRQSADS